MVGYNILMAEETQSQRIVRLTPLADVLAAIDRAVKPVSAIAQSIGKAAGRVLAEDCSVEHAAPSCSIAMRDGWAVNAETVADAGPYAPVMLNPPPTWLNAGEPMPEGADAILPADGIRIDGNLAEALMPAVPGEGVLRPGEAAAAGTVIRKAGEHLRPLDLALAALCGIAEASVRVPEVALVGSGNAEGSATTLDYFQSRVTDAGGAPSAGANFEQVLSESDADAIIAIGGTGTGRNDRAVAALARLGEVKSHGIAISPGNTAAFGFVREKPVLILPGRFDAAFAAWLLLGRALLARLTQSREEDARVGLKLAKKIASPPGLSEVVLVKRDGGKAIPLASGFFPVRALAEADGWLVIPPESEGFPEGAPVEMSVLP